MSSDQVQTAIQNKKREIKKQKQESEDRINGYISDLENSLSSSFSYASKERQIERLSPPDADKYERLLR